ncbi:MAG TPA: ATP-binding protein, partial [Chloroflexota bacterium]
PLASGAAIEAAIDGTWGLAIGLAYLAIFAAVLYLVARSRGGLPFAWVYLLVGALLSARGLAHVLNQFTAWSLARWLDIALTVVTTLAAVALAVALPLLVPRVLALLHTVREAEAHQARLAVQAAALRVQAAMLDLAHDAILVHRRGDHVITYWNDGATALYGWTAQEAVGQPVQTLLHGQLPRPFDEIQAVLNATGRWEGELGQTRRDGVHIVVESRWALQRDAAGQPLAYLEINRDSTERTQAAALLQEREASLEAAQRIAHLGSFDRQIVDGPLWWSDELYRIFGRLPGAFVPTYDRFLAAVAPADRERVAAAVSSALAGDQPYAVQFAIQQPDGGTRVVHAQGEVARAADGTPTRMAGTVLDVTERTRTVEALARQVRDADVARSETRAVLDATEEAMGLLAADGRVVLANQQVQDLLGLPVGILIGRTLTDLQTEVLRVFADPGALQTLADLLADPSRRVTLDIRQHWPQERDLELYSTPVHAADGELLGRLFAFRDVTQERAVQRMKDEFVSLVSHELRTPLTSIKGYTDLLLAGEVGALATEQREFLEIVQRNADREVTLVNDLLDLSRLEAGQMELRRTRLALSPLLQEVADAFRPQLDAKQQRLTLDLAPHLPPVLGDAERLTQVFTNLISNAHKYSPAGATITVSAMPQGDGLRVDVRDTGIGLTPEEQARIFTRFYRADNRTTREVGGTGLGLAITRALVERHEGTITVSSAPGAGSTFSVTLPRCAGTPT